MEEGADLQREKDGHNLIETWLLNWRILLLNSPPQNTVTFRTVLPLRFLISHAQIQPYLREG